MNIEKQFLKTISKTLSNNSFLGDDCAYLKDFNLCISQDTLYEDVHFKMSTISPYELGKKAVLVNISDVLASGAKPNYVTISLCGNLKNSFVEEFYKGVEKTCQEYGVCVVGGDLTGGEKIVISICALGDTKDRNISSRKNAKVGYIIAACGNFGASAKGFKELEFGTGEHIKAHLEPKLFPLVSENIATVVKSPYAMMDSSDGLYDVLSQISEQSGVRIDVEYKKIPKGTQEKELVLFGGEDYALVAVFEEKYLKQIPNLVQIGKISEGQGVFIDSEEINYDKSYKHWS